MNYATKQEIIAQINEFENIIKSVTGVQKSYYQKLVKKAINDIKTGNYNK